MSESTVELLVKHLSKLLKTIFYTSYEFRYRLSSCSMIQRYVSCFYFLFFTFVSSISFPYSYFEDSRHWFTDSDLQLLLERSERLQTAGIIWIWSPRMNLSSAGQKELHPIAALLDLEQIYLVDPYVSEEEILKAAKVPHLVDSPRMRSDWLYRHGGLLHYPVLFIYKNGKILLPSRPGYDEPGRLYEYLARRLR